MLAVADAFDAMTSDRSYRGARPVPEAITELRKWAGKQFDPSFVDAFVTAIERDGWTAPEPAPAEDPLRTSRACDTVASRRYEPRGFPRPALDSGQWLLVAFAALLVTWSVAQTAVSGVHDVHAALAFGALSRSASCCG